MTVLRWVGQLLYTYRWLVLISVGVVAFILGWVGFDRYFATHPAATNDNAIESDAAYSSLKLFLWNGPDYTSVPWQLEIARFLAGFVASFAAVSAIAALFRDQIQRTRIRFMSNHVVVCGLGYVGSLFLSELRDQGVRAVVIESDPTNPLLDTCRAWRIPVILGEAQLHSTLTTAGVQRAAGLLAVCPDDAVNTEIVAVARQLAEESRNQSLKIPTDPRALLTATRQQRDLSCLARIGDPDLCRLLRIQETDLRDPSSSLVFFNTDEISARFLLDEFGIDPADNGRPHILVSNLESLGQWLVLRAALTWYWLGPKEKDSLFITVVDEDAKARVRTLLDQHPDLDEICHFIYCSPSIRALRALPEKHAEEHAPPVTGVYVSAYRDEDALEIALRLRHELDPRKLGHRPDAPLPMVVALSRPDGAARVISQANQNGRLKGVTVFPALERTCTVELVEGGLHEPLAVALHNLWRAKELDKGKPAPVWEELDESRKESSRAQARDIVPKLLSIQCDLAPLRHWGAAKFEFEDDEVEVLAAAEHQRWVDERVAAGWMAGPKDPKEKTTPYLVPFEELPEDVADYDRMFVREIPAVLALAGLQVIRVPTLAGTS